MGHRGSQTEGAQCKGGTALENHAGHRKGRWLDYDHLTRLLNPDREQLFPRPEILALLNLGEGMTVADIGAGSGYMTGVLATAVGVAGRVAAVDPSPAAREHLAERRAEGPFHQVEIRDGTASATTLPDACADRVLWQAVYHEFPDHAAAFLEARRILKPRGLLVMVDWDPSHEGVGPPAHERVTSATARQAAEATGFLTQTETRVSDAVWAVVAARP